ncbi:Zn-ribbon domain-containing OB-fold protein [Acuticoccus sp. I52.16.1]|uniref:Zn-ribbon domain-containing OB-fold protein n=1 Tax=Acuticoccus sp. I52.16.1 TaxID=2928472 RepID=UPI001FD127D4|nr:Zn-ribbon domain-containing OB-fold protein [Acuticoccus sp. I52.16.1]UOM37260.1 Zn-ribbon domain-containing OB-fold protein [Acuticoccus sp. I52.16.1]
MARSETRPVPQPTPETQHFWDGLAERRILIQHCTPCDRAYFPPRNHCPFCGGTAVEVVRASGAATLYSFVVSNHRVPGFARPNVVAVAALAEGPRLMTQIVDVAPDPANLTIDMPLEPVFEDLPEGPTLLHFRPAPNGAAR